MVEDEHQPKGFFITATQKLPLLMDALLQKNSM